MSQLKDKVLNGLTSNVNNLVNAGSPVNNPDITSGPVEQTTETQKEKTISNIDNIVIAIIIGVVVMVIVKKVKF